MSSLEKEIKKLWHEDSQVVRALITLQVDGLIAQVTGVRYSLPR